MRPLLLGLSLIVQPRQYTGQGCRMLAYSPRTAPFVPEVSSTPTTQLMEENEPLPILPPALTAVSAQLRCPASSARPTALATPSVHSPHSLTGLSRESLPQADLWSSFGDTVDHLSASDCENLYACLHVLLASVSLAVRAIALEAHALKQRGGVIPLDSSPALECLAVVAAVTTARDFLLLRLDAATVGAALLSEVINDRTPTWPATPMSDSFRMDVESILDQMRRMRALQACVPDLKDDFSALQVRGVLVAAIATPGPGGSAEQSGGTADPRALLVLLGSALTRLRAASLRSVAEQQALAIEAIQLYAPLAHAVGFGAAFSELETLAYRKLYPDSMRKLQSWYQQVWPDGDSVVRHLREALEAQLLEAPSLTGLLQSVEVTSRIKTVPSTFRKLLRSTPGEKSIDTVRDIMGLRVVLTPSPTAVEMLQNLLGRTVTAEEMEVLLCHASHRQIIRLWREEPGRFKVRLRSNPTLHALASESSTPLPSRLPGRTSSRSPSRMDIRASTPMCGSMMVASSKSRFARGACMLAPSRALPPMRRTEPSS